MGLFVEDKKKEKVSEALKPAFFAVPAFIKNETAAKNGNTDEERILAAGSQTEFWKTLKDYIDEVVSDLENMNAQAIAQGLPFEEIGKNAIVINLTKGILTKIFSKVQDAKDALEEAAKNG